jgi:hypothetical protein
VFMRMGRAAALLGATAVVLGLGAAVIPASAAVVKPTVGLEHIVLLPGGSSSSPWVSVSRPGAAVTVHDLTVTIDLGGVSRFASVQRFLPDDTCAVTATQLSCRLGEHKIDGYTPLVPLWAQATETAVAGDAGTVTTTVTSREFGSLVRRSTVTIAEGVTLEPGADLSRTVKPGQKLNLALSVRNAGDRPITATVMWFYREAMFTYPQRFSNCQYSAERVFCRFEDDVPAGETYRLSTPLAVTVRKQVPAPETIGHTVHWATPADSQDELESFRTEKPKKGTGTALRLVRTTTGAVAAPAAAAAALPQSDPSGTFFTKSQNAFLTVTGRNVADLAAVGADAKGKVGKTVSVKVGAKNLGPAFVFGVRKPAANVVVGRPKGTTVVSVPAGCLPSSKGKVVKRKDPRGAAEYLCTTVVNPFEVGQKVTWTFKLRIDKKGALTGSVRVVPSTVDGKRTNNSAKLRVNRKK